MQRMFEPAFDRRQNADIFGGSGGSNGLYDGTLSSDTLNLRPYRRPQRVSALE